MPFDQAGFGDDEQVLGILRAARHRIRLPSLWCKGYMHTDNDQHCMIGAIDNFKDDIIADRIGTKALIWLGNYLAEYGCNVSLFNDDPKTQHKDVMALFDRAIADLETRLCASSQEILHAV